MATGDPSDIEEDPLPQDNDDEGVAVDPDDGNAQPRWSAAIDAG